MIRDKRENEEPREYYTSVMEELCPSSGVREVFVPHKNRKLDGATRLVIDFATPEAMVDWLEANRGVTLPVDVSAFEMDALDTASSWKPKADCTFIVRRTTDRPDQTRVHVRTIEESGA
jgi:hypothetical protein